ncbi:MAG: hypothetical protein IKU85_02545 [Bacteroidaceae bacterium]|nr:hypothetical protein [Bacteroidaceae bacterium]
MESLKTYVRKFMALLGRLGRYISYVWFLIPVGYYYGVKGTFKYMQTSPEKTDFYLGIDMLMLLLHIVAILFLLHRRSMVQFSLAVVVGFFMFAVAVLGGMMLESAPTDFARKHPIPEGLAYHLPLPEHADMEAKVNPADSTTYLQIRNGLQGGIYEFSFFYPQLPEGVIHLQCYEAGTGLSLSAREIKKKTRHQVGKTDNFTCLIRNKEFTIYEGDWGDCYAARVEVWFEDKKGTKRKLTEKTYGVQGWMK